MAFKPACPIANSIFGANISTKKIVMLASNIDNIAIEVGAKL